MPSGSSCFGELLAWTAPARLTIFPSVATMPTIPLSHGWQKGSSVSSGQGKCGLQQSAPLSVFVCVCVSVTKSVGELEFANFFRWLVETCLPNPHVRLSSSSRGTMSREPTHQTSLRMSSTKKMEQRSALRTPYWGRKYFGLKPGGLQPGRVLGDAALRFGLGWRLVTDLSGIPCYLSVSSSKFTTPT